MIVDDDVRTAVRKLAWVLIVFLAAGLVTAAWAAETFRIQDPTGKDAVVMVLRDGACVDKQVLEYLHENVLDDRRFKKMDLEWEGQEYGACWIEVRGNVHGIGSDKRPLQPIPRAAFKDESI